MPLNFVFNLESNAVLLKFWRLQPTLPCFGLQYSISKKTRTTVSLSSMQRVFAESSLRKQAWRNPKEGRVGCLHQNIFTRKVTDIAFTSDFCNNYSYSASPASLYLTSPRPCPSSQVPLSRPSSLKTLVSRPQVPSPHTRVPMSPSPCPRPTQYTQPPTCKLNLRHTWKNTAIQLVGKNLVRQKELAWNLYTVWHKFLENTKQPNNSSFLTYFMISVTDVNLLTHAEM